MPKRIKRDFNISHDEVKSTIEYATEIYDELSDEQLERIERFKKLEVYQQDLLMLSSQGYSLREIGNKLNVSYNWVRDRLNEINDILNDKV